jgi:hypothetical protein
VPARLQRIAQADTAGSLASSPRSTWPRSQQGRRAHHDRQRLGPRHRHVEPVWLDRKRPLTLGRGFEQDACGHPTTEQHGEPLRGGADASPDHFAVLGEDAELALALVEIESDIVPGWPPRRAALTA